MSYLCIVKVKKQSIFKFIFDCKDTQKIEYKRKNMSVYARVNNE
jgi:hypothetical protein